MLQFDLPSILLYSISYISHENLIKLSDTDLDANLIDLCVICMINCNIR